MDWIKDIRAKQKGTQNNLIYKLSFLGWTQREVGKRVGLSREGVKDIIGNKSSFEKIGNDFEKGKSIIEIAEYHGLELTTAWAIIPIKNLP